ncbi:MAG: hypothetical protein ACOVRN_04490 [Flavobacterium sp.]
MKRLFLFLLMVSLNCYSQSSGDEALVESIKWADSIYAKDNGYYKSDGQISITENGIQTAAGGFSYSYSLYMPYLEEWKKLPPEQKRKFNFKKDKRLVKGYYHQVLHYEKEGYSKETKIELYYNNNNELYFARVVFRTYNNSKELEKTIKSTTVTQGIFPSNVNPDIKDLIIDKNTEILKAYNKD